MNLVSKVVERHSQPAPGGMRDAARLCESSALLVGTQDPWYEGGLPTMLRAFLAGVQHLDLRPTLAYTPLVAADPVNAGLGSLWRGRLRPRVEIGSWQGHPTYKIGRLFPSLESMFCRGNGKLWKELCARFLFHQAVCGYAITGLPQVLHADKAVLWVATSMTGDKRARWSNAGWLRRLAYRVQDKTLLGMERQALEGAAWVLTLSQHTHEELLQRGAAPERTTLLPCAVDVKRFQPAISLPPRPTVVWSGRHEDPRKNSLLLLRAFARVARSVPDSRLCFVGSGRELLQPHVAALNLQSKVDLVGHKDPHEIPALLQQASVFCIPSDQEGLCIAALEAMACGLPVISTRCGGPETFVRPEQTGLLVDRGDEEQLAEALRHLLVDESRSRQLGHQGRQLIERDYSPAAFAQTLRSVYAQVWPERFACPAPS